MKEKYCALVHLKRIRNTYQDRHTFLITDTTTATLLYSPLVTILPSTQLSTSTVDVPTSSPDYSQLSSIAIQHRWSSLHSNGQFKSIQLINEVYLFSVLDSNNSFQ